MGMTIQFPNWTLNYQVAAVGAYATILVESIYLILGGLENTSLLSISILTNTSVVLFAGFGNASSTPLVSIRICLTGLFLLWAIVFHENETVDGTYAIFCSVVHLFYQLQLRHNDDRFEGFLPPSARETRNGSQARDPVKGVKVKYQLAVTKEPLLSVIIEIDVYKATRAKIKVYSK